MNFFKHLFVSAAIFCCNACTDPVLDNGFDVPGKGVLKGRIIDSQGKPVAGAEIIASNLDHYNATRTGRSDDKGTYVVQLPTGIGEGSFTASANVVLPYHGKNYTFPLYEENPDAFSPYDGAVRDFELRLTGKRSPDADENDPLGGKIEVHRQVDRVNAEHLEITLEPTGTLIDGLSGKKIVTTLPANDFYLRDIPVGEYKITARDKVTGEKLGVSVMGNFNGYKPSVTAMFDDTFDGSGHFELGILVDVLD